VGLSDRPALFAWVIGVFGDGIGKTCHHGFKARNL
jgi:hypothetical protein